MNIEKKINDLEKRIDKLENKNVVYGPVLNEPKQTDEELEKYLYYLSTFNKKDDLQNQRS